MPSLSVAEKTSMTGITQTIEIVETTGTGQNPDTSQTTETAQMIETIQIQMDADGSTQHTRKATTTTSAQTQRSRRATAQPDRKERRCMQTADPPYTPGRKTKKTKSPRERCGTLSARRVGWLAMRCSMRGPARRCREGIRAGSQGEVWCRRAGGG